MKNMTNFFCFVIFCCGLFSVKSSNASHASGAEFSYTCLGNNNYQINYTLYRDCHGIIPNDSIDLNIQNNCGFGNSIVYIFRTGAEIELSSTCRTASTGCNGGAYFGIEKWSYQGIISLPGECEWTISHSEGSRVAVLTTILGAGVDYLYVYCKINNISALCNSSPVFANDPILNYCVGQRSTIYNSVHDVEGDSIAFEMIAPRTGNNISDTVTFYSSYSSQQPILANYISWDEFSGELTFIGSQADFSLAAFLVKEFRNGILIGEIEREMIINLDNCNNVVPFLTGFNSTSSFYANVYPNQQNCFFIASIDPNANDSTFIHSTTPLLPGMSMTTTNGQIDSINICWNPFMADTSSTYCFDLIVSDNNCPFLGIRQEHYCMYVMNSVNLYEIENNDFSIWPNPFKSELNLSFSENYNISTLFEISIYDFQGREVKCYSEIINNTIPLNDLNAGIYFVKLKSKKTGYEVYRKIIKE